MPADTIRIMCPNLTCRKVLAVPKTARGKTVRCRNCSTCIRIPDPTGSSAPDGGKEAQSAGKAPGQKPGKAAEAA